MRFKGDLLKLAIAGKGGVGKTTLAGILARLFGRDGYSVIAIDADPDMNLASSIGIKEDPTPIIGLKKLIEERAGLKGGIYNLNPKVDDIVDEYGAEGPDNVKLLVMGAVKKGGTGCYCPESAFLRALMRHMIIKRKEVLIMDMEAGIEHLGRGTAQNVDLMLVVVEPGKRSIETAERVKSLSHDVGIKDVFAVGNKISHPEEEKFIEKGLSDVGIPLLGKIPFDPMLMKSDMEGESLLDAYPDSEIVKAIDKVRERLINEGGSDRAG